MDSKYILPIVGLLLVVGASLVPTLTAGSGLAASTEYEVTVADSVDTPSRTVTFQDRNHDITAIGTADPGDTVSVSVTAPAESYDVYLYNGDEQIVSSQEGNDDGTFSFDMSGYDPGSYLIAVYHDGHYQAVHPVVVRGYDVSVEASETVTAGDDVAVTVDVTQTADAPAPDSVEVALADNDETVRVTATQESETTYTASVPTSDLGTGEYALHAAVRIDEQAFDERAIVGVSESAQVSITEQSTTTEDSSTDDGSSTGGTTTTETTAETTTETTTPATATTVNTETTTATTQPTTAATDTIATTEQPTTEDDSVLTPDESTTESEADSDSSGQPGLGILATVAAILSMAVLASRRLRRR